MSAEQDVLTAEVSQPSLFDRLRGHAITVISVLMCLFTLLEVNYPQLKPQASKALFVMFGLVLCFLLFPMHKRFKDRIAFKVVDVLLALATVVCCGFIVTQNEPVFEWLWIHGKPLSVRVQQVETIDFWMGLIGIALIFEATRRSIGLAVPILAVVFILFAVFRDLLPSWALAHQPHSVTRVIEQCFLQGRGVFGMATSVMFQYVFLFVVFGAFLEVTGATQFIVDFAQSVFGKSPGGPAKVSVLGSGLMGSLSGSAVANAVTTGTFTIPMMRSAGFKPHIAGGITAAAAAGGALVPPVMGAGAYMMLDIGIEGVSSFLQIAKAAVVPAFLYYLSIFMIVHFYSGRMGSQIEERQSNKTLWQIVLSFEGVVFVGALGSLVTALLFGYSPYRAVTISLGVILALGLIHPRKRITLRVFVDALTKSARTGTALVAASACVGIVIGIVHMTSVAQMLGGEVKVLVEHSLFLALLGIMGCSIVLGMGVPSVVCYLLMATLMGALLNNLGVIPLAAHLFIFYFGMMSMVTPPVALAAYASASIAKAPVMSTAFAAFRFSLVGFTLPFMFVYRPALLLMSTDGGVANWFDVVLAITVAAIGIVALASGIAGFFRAPLTVWSRIGMWVSAAMLLSPDVMIGSRNVGIYANIGGAVLFGVMAAVNWRPSPTPSPEIKPTT